MTSVAVGKTFKGYMELMELISDWRAVQESLCDEKLTRLDQLRGAIVRLTPGRMIRLLRVWRRLVI